jgi:hypothetical protein
MSLLDAVGYAEMAGQITKAVRKLQQRFSKKSADLEEIQRNFEGAQEGIAEAEQKFLRQKDERKERTNLKIAELEASIDQRHAQTMKFLDEVEKAAVARTDALKTIARELDTGVSESETQEESLAEEKQTKQSVDRAEDEAATVRRIGEEAKTSREAGEQLLDRAGSAQDIILDAEGKDASFDAAGEAAHVDFLRDGEESEEEKEDSGYSMGM